MIRIANQLLGHQYTSIVETLPILVNLLMPFNGCLLNARPSKTLPTICQSCLQEFFSFRTPSSEQAEWLSRAKGDLIERNGTWQNALLASFSGYQVSDTAASLLWSGGYFNPLELCLNFN